MMLAIPHSNEMEVCAMCTTSHDDIDCNAAQPYTLLWHSMHFCSTQLYCDFILQHIVILSSNN